MSKASEREQARLQMPAHPMPAFPVGTPVSVFMGAGWKKGRVTSRTRTHVSVRLDRENRSTNCSDARNIKKL